MAKLIFLNQLIFKNISLNIRTIYTCPHPFLKMVYSLTWFSFHLKFALLKLLMETVKKFQQVPSNLTFE